MIWQRFLVRLHNIRLFKVFSPSSFSSIVTVILVSASVTRMFSFTHWKLIYTLKSELQIGFKIFFDFLRKSCKLMSSYTSNKEKNIMDLFDELLQRLRSERAQGVTNREMAERAGLSQQHINGILNGKRPLKGMSIESIIRLFPGLKITLDKSAMNLGNVRDGVGAAAGPVTLTVNPTSEADLTAAADRIMESDMCDACKVKAWKLLRASGESAE